MLWKYKKCYQEDNDDVVNPRTCNFLKKVTGIFTGLEGDPTSTEVRYILCEDETDTEIVGTLSVANPVLNVNVCIKESSLFVDGVNITNEITTLTPYWGVSADFDDCGDGRCSLYAIDNTGEVTFLSCDNELLTELFEARDEICSKEIFSSSGHSLIGLCP
jgi:hypothetical protein